MAQTIQDLTILLLVSLPIILLFHKFKLPSVVGFLLAGMLIGPYGFQLIHDPESVEQLAEIGVILLLFIIGLEFSLGTLLKNWARLLGTGSLQLVLTTGAVYFFVTGWMDVPGPNVALVVGLLAALSSTAIVLQMITLLLLKPIPYFRVLAFIVVGVYLWQAIRQHTPPPVAEAV